MDRDIIQLRYGIVGSSPEIRRAVDRLIQVAPTDLTVLISGESGTGKEVFAKAIHALSHRKSHRLMSINCAAIPETLLESELFGHEKGAFTGASDQRKGYFETAHKGTIFLDEIGEMPLGTQVKLLRVLESGEFSRLGSSDIHKVDARVIAATNRNLDEEVFQKRFRQDLFYRLNAVNIELPPLRTHLEDIPLLVEFFARRTCEKLRVSWEGISEDTLRVLQNLPWQGNIRELKNMIETVTTLEKGKFITLETLRPYLPLALKAHQPSYNEPTTMIELSGRTVEQVERELMYKILLEIRGTTGEIKDLLLQDRHSVHQVLELPAPTEIKEARVFEPQEKAEFLPEDSLRLDEMEKRMIREALRRSEGNRRVAAKQLGISERTLYRKLREYGMEKLG